MSVEQIIAFEHTESSSDIAKALLTDLSKKGSTAFDELNIGECEKARAIRYDLILRIFMLWVMLHSEH